MTTVAVRELCEFTAKRGDLDLRFTPAPTSEEGIAGHGIVQRRRGTGYQSEIRLESVYKTLKLRGRADGMRPAPNLVLEEIKTFRGDLRRQPDNHRELHWAQLKMYGAQLCEEKQLEQLKLSLIYFDVDQQDETPVSAEFSAQELGEFYRSHCETYLAWDEQQQAHRAARDAALAQIKFPHAEFHSGQRQLAEAVYRACARNQPLLAQAPTGIGKSIGTLFPALKAMGAGKLDKIFFLTAKTSGRQSAFTALENLRRANDVIPLRALELVAREKSCAHPDKACHGESCPLAKGFYDRLPAARAEAAQRHTLDQQAVREVAQRHEICPYYLSQDLVRWSDVVVGDYNYYFDRSALLHGLTELNGWRVAVLTDEAHNLVERGRGMYSAELDQRALAALRPLAPAAVKRALTGLQTRWNALNRVQASDYEVHALLPSALLEALQKVSAAISEYYADHPSAVNPDLQRQYFDLLGFLALAEEFGEHSLFDVTQNGPPARQQSVIALRNIVPARFLRPRFETAAATIGFSATLNPPQYYRDLLGLPEDTPWLDVPSPFSAEQLQVRRVTNISTRYKRRAESIAPIAQLIAQQFRAQPGNYLAFFSSYEYLDQVSAELAAQHAEVPVLAQARRMSEPERNEFLARFTETSAAVGLAVLGGAFAEGVDLPGKRLIGAFVATLGLPQFNPFNEQVRQRMAALFGEDLAYDYSYLFPGLQKVVQAAGRVIRDRNDRGVVYLIDDRFGQRSVRELLPAWWQDQ